MGFGVLDPLEARSDGAVVGASFAEDAAAIAAHTHGVKLLEEGANGLIYISGKVSWWAFGFAESGGRCGFQENWLSRVGAAGTFIYYWIKKYAFEFDLCVCETFFTSMLQSSLLVLWNVESVHWF